jgi:hypothetical protein
MSKKKRRRGITKQDVAVVVGAAAAASIQACNDNGGTICDPPPPPLCGMLSRDTTMAITADRDTVPPGGSVTFSGTIVDTLVRRIEGEGRVSYTVGTMGLLTVIPPLSFTFSWSPPAAGSHTGSYSLVPEFQVLAYGEGEDSTYCVIAEEIKVEIDSTGTAVIVSLPRPQDALGLHFGVTIEARPAGDGFDLAAGTNLPAEVAEKVTWKWRVSGGRIEAAGGAARFVPDPGAAVAVVQAEAHVGEGSLAVASWTWKL